MDAVDFAARSLHSLLDELASVRAATLTLFRSFRPDLPLLAETSGKNALVVTPSADLDLAVKDVVTSAFGHAGQKCSAASLVVLVGSVARSRRFRDQLVDAVTSLRVGLPEDPEVQVGPLVEPASGKLLRALTELAPGERWLVLGEMAELGDEAEPGVFNMAVVHLHRGAPGAATGVSQTGIYVGAAGGPAAFGALYSATGYGTAWLAAATAAGAAAAAGPHDNPR